MNDPTPPGVRLLCDNQLPSLRELYKKQITEMTNAETKAEAYDAIEPLVYLAGLYEWRPIFRELPPGGPVPERVAAVTPLTEKEVQKEIVNAAFWWLGLRATKDSGQPAQRAEG